MKKLLILTLAFLVSYGAEAKEVGDTINYNGKTYYIGPNVISNPSFNGGFTGWTDGTTTGPTGTELTSTYWKVNKSGGVDGNWLIGITNSTKVHAGGLCTAWKIGHDSIYYFSFYISNRTKSTNPNVANYQMVSATNTIGTESKVLLGTGYKNNSNPMFGETTVALGDTTWTENKFIFDNSAQETPYDYMQCCFRWEGPNLFGFDKFCLAPLLDITTTTPAQIVSMQFQNKVNQLQQLEMSSTMSDYPGLVTLIEDCLGACDKVNEDNIDDMNAAMVKIDNVIAVTNKGIDDLKSLTSLLTTAQTMLNTTAYPGADALTAAIEAADALLQNSAETTAQQYSDGLDALTKAISDYRFSQSASDDAPADFTFMVKAPNFKADDTAADSKTNLSRSGWVDGSTYKGTEQYAEYYTPYCAWKAWWSTSATDTRILDIHQTITGLPAGFYKVSCLAKTQANCISDQHAYAKSAIQSGVSPVMTQVNAFDSLVTSKVYVNDGQLVIGFTSSKSNADPTLATAGWWKVTHFKLYYTGAATESELTALYNGDVTKATAMADTMHFAGDKKSLKDTIAAYTGATGIDNIITAWGKVNKALNAAVASENKYDAIYGASMTMKVLEDSLNASTSAYQAANAIASFAYKQAKEYITSDTATYTMVDGLMSRLTRYTAKYAPAYNTAADSIGSFKSTAAKEYLQKITASQSALLTADTLKNTAIVDSLTTALNNATNLCNAQNQYEQNKNASDYTFMIQNPDAGGESNNTTGWTLSKGTGDATTSVKEHYNGATFRYFNSYNSVAGKLNYFGSQVIYGVPNGTYTMKVATRSDASNGFYLFASNGGTEKTDTTWQKVELPTHIIIGGSPSGTDTAVVASNKYGKIWEDANAAVDANSYTALQYTQAQVNNGSGYGWHWVSLENYVVTNHQIVIGMTTDSLRTGEALNGKWFSAVDFSLVKTADGDNANWDGPISTGVSEATIINSNTQFDGIYSLSGIKMNANAAQNKGIYIIKQNGKTKKVLVK